jgi:DNA-binding transcriptional ArsR family regulator
VDHGGRRGRRRSQGPAGGAAGRAARAGAARARATARGRRRDGRRLGVPLGTLEYHLKYLVDREYLSIRDEGGYKRYYPVGTMRSVDKNILSLLRQDIPRRLVMYILLHPDSRFGDLAQKFDVAPSTLSFHVTKLLKAGIVSKTRLGRETTYKVENEHEVAMVLIAHRRSFLDVLVDSFVGTWTDLHP